MVFILLVIVMKILFFMRGGYGVGIVVEEKGYNVNIYIKIAKFFFF